MTRNPLSILALSLSALSAPIVHATTVATTTSASGKAMRLTFAEDDVTTDSVAAIACSTPAAGVSEAVLWMPEHGHGSTPTTLTRRSDGCTVITDIDFSMAGHWQVRIRYADGDRGVFDVNVD